MKQEIYLPAHGSDLNDGFVFRIELHCQESDKTSFAAEGYMGTYLLPLFQRIYDVLGNQMFSWGMLDNKKYCIYANYADYKIAQMESAGLGVAVGYYNLARKINGSSVMSGVTGTGVIRSTGHVQPIAGDDAKLKAAKFNIPNFKKLITPDTIKHINELHRIIGDIKWKLGF